jgi:glutathione S-transferase
MDNMPILWSFRRCPYAMRARLALASAGVEVELREILLKDKPAEFLRASPSATVPALQLAHENLDESLDIMIWALRQNDPEAMLDMPQQGWGLIADNDGPFKAALDHTKYAVRYPERDAKADRAKAAHYLHVLEGLLTHQKWLFANKPTFADIAILPFIRQFANTDKAWFDAQPWPHVIAWLDHFVQSPRFAAIMTKWPVWVPDAPPVIWR